MKLYTFRTVPLSNHQEFFPVHTAMVYVIQVFWKLVRRSKCSCSQAVSKPVWHIPLLCVQWKTPDDGQRNCPKRVEFHSKNKFEKLVHLVGFIIRIFFYTLVFLSFYNVFFLSLFFLFLFYIPNLFSSNLPHSAALFIQKFDFIPKFKF